MRDSSLNDKTRLLHILDAISEIESYILNLDRPAFLENSLVRNATLMQIQILGEAASHLSDPLKNQFPEIEWKQIRSTRNLIAHEYFGIDFEIVWNIALYKLPELKQQIRQVLDTAF